MKIWQAEAWKRLLNEIIDLHFPAHEVTVFHEQDSATLK